MPSAFTHFLVGAAAARILPADLPRLRIGLAFGIAAALPDLDVAAFAVGIPYAHPLGHRGFFHSLLFALLFGGFIGVAAIRDDSRARNRRPILLFAGFLAIASHGLLDAATDAGKGVGFFIPFSNARYFLPWRPIETASIRPERFFSLRGLAILESEIRWVWLPLLAVFVPAQLISRRFRRAAGGRKEIAEMGKRC